MWGRFLDAITRWSRRRKVDVITVQEHNLHPDRDAALKRGASEVGMTLHIAYAPAAADGNHWGGVLMLTFDNAVHVKRDRKSVV